MHYRVQHFVSGEGRPWCLARTPVCSVRQGGLFGSNPSWGSTRAIGLSPPVAWRLEQCIAPVQGTGQKLMGVLHACRPMKKPNMRG